MRPLRYFRPAPTLLGSLFSLVSGTPLHADTAVAIGSCNIVQQNITVSGGSTVTTNSNCCRGDECFTVRYLWLDEATSSELVAGYLPKNISSVVGSTYMIVRDNTYLKLAEIVNRFGVKLKTDITQNGTQYQLFGTKGDSVSFEDDGARVSLAILRKLRFYSSQNIILPEVTALTTLLKTQTWPPNYRITYEKSETQDLSLDGINHGDQPAQTNALSCVLLYKYVSKTEIENYWSSMENLETQLQSSLFKRAQVVNSALGNVDPRVDALQNHSIDAMLYFGQANWPDDFLLGFGDSVPGGCGSYQIGFYAKPRELFTLVAVIEATHVAIEIEGMEFGVDPDEKLHPLRPGTVSEKGPPGAIVLDIGQTAVIPLRIELRYDLEAPPVNALTTDKAATPIYNQIMRFPRDVFQFTDPVEEGKGRILNRVIFEKLKGELRKPESSSITQTYIFGPAYSLKNIVLKGQMFPIRPAPASALALVGNSNTGGGSCPFLFVKDETDSYVRIGRTLIGAHNKDLAREEGVVLPKGTQSIAISEQEPEITYLTRVLLRVDSKEEVLAENVIIRPGHSKEFQLSEPLGQNTQLILQGYYEPLGVSQSIN